MKKSLLVLSIVITAALLLHGCAAKEESAMHQETKGNTVTIAGGDFFEACDMEKNWQPGSTLNYTFSSSKPVIFDIHYHAEHAKVYPVEPTLTDKLEGSFVVEGEAIHCGMWKNGNPEPVTVTFDMSVAKM